MIYSFPDVQAILQKHFHVADWLVTTPRDGQQKACFIAQHDAMRVFIKFDVPVAALQRLGEIGVAPRVIASGTLTGNSYVVQEYITGSYPDWHWFAHHLPCSQDSSTAITAINRLHRY